jgi:uncharacterized protein YjdB
MNVWLLNNMMKIVLSALLLLPLTGCFCGQFFRGPDDVAAITISPANTSILPGATQKFSATATFGGNGSNTDGNGGTGDVTLQTTWASSDSTIVSIDNTGLAKGLKLGTVTISGDCECLMAQAGLTVSSQPAALISIAVTPANTTMQVSLTQQLVAIGTYSNGATRILTNSVVWTSSDNTGAIVNSGGLATGVGTGNVTIFAASGDVIGKTILAVH